VVEQPTTMPLYRRPQHLGMNSQRRPHRLRIGLPAARRTLDVGEQERDRSRGRPNPHEARSYAHTWIQMGARPAADGPGTRGWRLAGLKRLGSRWAMDTDRRTGRLPSREPRVGIEPTTYALRGGLSLNGCSAWKQQAIRIRDAVC